MRRPATKPVGPSHEVFKNPVQVVGSAEIEGGHGELGPAAETVN